MLFLIIEILGILYVIYRYRLAQIKHLNFWGNPNFYLFFLAIFYLIHPCYFYYQEIFRLSVYDETIINSVYSWCIYYYFIFLIFYIISSDKLLISPEHKIVYISKLGKKFIVTFLLTSFVILSILVLYGTRQINNGTSRIIRYEFYEKITKFIGFIPLVWFIITWSFVMAMMTKKLYYLFFFLPLLYLEFACSSRFYIFIFIIALLSFRLNVIRKNINPIYFVSIAIFLFSIGIIREHLSGINLMSIYLTSFGEFINTWSSIGLLLNEKFIFASSPLFVFVQSLIPEPFSGLVFGPKLNYAAMITSMHNFNFGLGSSVVTEGVVYGFFFASIFPIIIGLIYFILHKYLNRNTISNKLIFFFLIITTYSIYRGAAIINISSHIMIYFFIFKIPYSLLKYFALIKVKDAF